MIQHSSVYNVAINRPYASVVAAVPEFVRDPRGLGLLPIQVALGMAGARPVEIGNPLEYVHPLAAIDVTMATSSVRNQTSFCVRRADDGTALVHVESVTTWSPDAPEVTSVAVGTLGDAFDGRVRDNWAYFLAREIDRTMAASVPTVE